MTIKIKILLIFCEKCPFIMENMVKYKYGKRAVSACNHTTG